MDDPVFRAMGPIVAVLGVTAAGLPIAIAIVLASLVIIYVFGFPKIERYYRAQIRAGNWDEVRRLEQGAIDMANRGKKMDLIFKKFAKIRKEEGLDY